MTKHSYKTTVCIPLTKEEREEVDALMKYKVKIVDIFRKGLDLLIKHYIKVN